MILDDRSSHSDRPVLWLPNNYWSSWSLMTIPPMLHHQPFNHYQPSLVDRYLLFFGLLQPLSNHPALAIYHQQLWWQSRSGFSQSFIIMNYQYIFSIHHCISINNDGGLVYLAINLLQWLAARIAYNYHNWSLLWSLRPLVTWTFFAIIIDL